MFIETGEFNAWSNYVTEVGKILGPSEFVNQFFPRYNSEIVTASSTSSFSIILNLDLADLAVRLISSTPPDQSILKVGRKTLALHRLCDTLP